MSLWCIVGAEKRTHKFPFTLFPNLHPALVSRSGLIRWMLIYNVFIMATYARPVAVRLADGPVETQSPGTSPCLTGTQVNR